MLRVVDKFERIGEENAFAVLARAVALQRSGRDVINLGIGQPDFPTPPHVVAAATAAAEGGDTKYPPVAGTPALRAAVQRKFRRDNGLDYALNEILVTNGGKQAIFDALMATCNPGDEVIIPTPAWISYTDMAKFAGAVPVFVPCPQNDGFRLQAEALDAAITPRTKWLLLNFPLLTLWDRGVLVAGLPLLPLALFIGWAALIAVAAWICEAEDEPD